ncbi:hypothetical protein [Streptomyces sp. NPDC012888]|uniref:hypothetical protein n=1 Tax=Streptomyces sp. NPDC012888 TaxID=3364855 RepID=UPI00367FB410
MRSGAHDRSATGAATARAATARAGTARGVVVAVAVAAVVAVLGGCGGPADDGFVAVGAAGAGPERSPGQIVPPGGRVEFQSLDGPSPAGRSPSAGSSGPSASSASAVPGPSGPGSGTGTPGTPPGSGPSGPDPAPPGPDAPGGPGPDGPGTPGPTAPPATPPSPEPPVAVPPPAKPPGSTAPATPARLVLGTPVRTATGDRWCEKVTVRFTNTGTTPARSGTVEFATHVIGALGIDWATIDSSQPLPAPIAGGTSRTHTYTVCVAAWRVPLGMHIETREVTATWK